MVGDKYMSQTQKSDEVPNSEEPYCELIVSFVFAIMFPFIAMEAAQILGEYYFPEIYDFLE